MIALRRVSRAVGRSASALQARDEAIREAAETHSLREVAKAAGLSHETVRKIAHGG